MRRRARADYQPARPLMLLLMEMLAALLLLEDEAEELLLALALLPPPPPPRIFEIVTLMPRLPLSANRAAVFESKTRQSDIAMAGWTPSWMLCGVASQVRRRDGTARSSLQTIRKGSMRAEALGKSHSVPGTVQDQVVKEEIDELKELIEEETTKENEDYV